ncbi:MAG TPA: malonyl-ACP O-methyltransferase BioC [Steroidobacteraceae bacterium]|nr:malonyl-ACP O-methyltransferase BioC [Steroidobacteraceae bacterium]
MTDLDPRAVARSFGAASDSYDAAAWLQAQAREELLSRLTLLKSPPRAVLDLGAGTGLAALAIKRRFPRAAVTAADIAAPMVRAARRHSRFWRRIRCVEADARQLPFDTAGFDLVFSNLMLQWLQPPDAALAEIRRVLRPGGLLLLSSFGPETLQELRAAWGAADDGVHVIDFVDVHDLGGALQRAGFLEPVLDVDRHLHHYADARALMRELKSLGARNVDARRARGLTGRAAFARMQAQYESLRRPAGLPATWQVVYAVAWAPEHGPEPAPASTAGETRIDVQSLRDQLARRR